MIRILLSILIVLSFCSESFAQRVTSPPQRIRFGTTLPSTCTNGMLFQDTDATAGQQIYACESGAWVLQGDGGGGGGDNITVNTTAATNANFLDNLYIDWAIDTAATPDDVTSKFNYAETLAGNPALLVDECVLFKDATGGGLLCEGSTADTNEQIYRVPDLNGADTDQDIVLDDETQTLTNKTMAAASNVLDADTAVALAADPADCATSTHFAVGVIASGAATCEAIGDADIPDSTTVTGWVMGASTATTPAIDDNDTSLATTAYVKLQIDDDLDTSAELIALVDDETGTGALVFGTSPTIATPTISGTPAVAGALGYNTTQAMQTTYGGITAVAAPIHGTIATGVGTQTLTNSTASDQDFTSAYTFPANSIYTNKVYLVTFLTEQITGVSSATLINYIKIGSTKVYTSGATNLTDNETRSNVSSFMIFGRAAAGASAAVSVGPIFPNMATNVTKNTVDQPVNLATNGTLTINFGVTWSGTGSTETVEQQAFIIEELN